MRARTIVALTVSFVCWTSGCSKPKGAEYFPELRDGASKVYSIEYNVPPTGVQKGRLAIRVDGTETINGKSYSKELTVPSGIPGAPTQTRFVRRDKTGIYAINGDDSTKTEYLEIPLPVQVGSSWTSKSPRGELHYRAEAIEAAQLFDRSYENCLKVSFTSSVGEGYACHAPGLGMVRSVIKASGVTMELTLDK